MSDWAADWKAGANYLTQEGWTQLSEAIASNPQQYQEQVAAYDQMLRVSSENLRGIRAKLAPEHVLEDRERLTQRYRELLVRYQQLAAQFYADTQKQPEEAVGFVPLMTVGYLLIGIAGATFALATYEYAANLRDQTALMRAELDARIELTQAGKTLQASTLPAAESPSIWSNNGQSETPGQWMKWVGLAALAGFGYWHLKKR
jgi:hypothetical protein